MLGTTEKNTYFTELDAIRRFAVYTGIYLAATLTIGCLGLIVGSTLLTFPLAVLISNPTVWVLMGVALAVTYELAIEPFFYLVRGSFKGKRTDQKKQKTPDGDSGIVPDSKLGSQNSSRGSFLDNGLSHENLDTLVHQTNRENYTYWLQQHDIAHVARIKYEYSEDSADSVFFCIPGNLETLNERLVEYKNRVEREGREVTFTSVVNLGNLHWTTLVVAYNLGSKQFRAYYCDSFGADLPSPGGQRKNIECASEIKGLIPPLIKQSRELYKRGRKEMGREVQKTAQTCRNKKNELVNVPINTDGIVSALEAALEIGSDDMRSSEAKQQNDGCNCGVFALENASKITQMLSEGRSFDEIDKELSEYKFDLNEKRREFAKALMNDEKWKEDLGNGLLYDLSPRTGNISVRHFKGAGPGL